MNNVGLRHSLTTLVIHTGGIGDLILACPALTRLATESPLHIAGRAERVALAVAAGIAHAAFDLESIDFASVFSVPSSRFVSFLCSYRRVIVWMRDEDGQIVDTLHQCGVAEAQAFPGLPPEGWTRHASDYYLECLGYPPETEPFQLSVSPWNASDVVIHPGSGGRRKNWPAEHFTELAARLQAQGREVTWSLGPAEENRPLPAGPHLSGLPLVELAAHLAGARLYIGNDSGITHLAAAVGCPTVVVFGPTDPGVWAPRGAHVRVASGKPWPSVKNVAALIRNSFGGRL